MTARSWRIQLNRNIRKRLERHGRAVNRRLKEALEKLQENPRQGKPLKTHKGIYSLGVGTPSGEFRIIYRLRHKDRVILVDLIEPREVVYKLLEHRRQ